MYYEFSNHDTRLPIQRYPKEFLWSVKVRLHIAINRADFVSW